MLSIGMRQYDDKWKAYCGWCNRVIAVCQNEREGEKELLWHRRWERCDSRENTVESRREER